MDKNILPQPTAITAKSDAIEVQVKKQQQQEVKKLRAVADFRNKNLILWEINLSDFSVKRAEIKQVINKTVHLMVVDGKATDLLKQNDHFVFNKGCDYVWKMNQTSAQKVANKLKALKNQ